MPWITLDRTGNETVTTPNRGTTAKGTYDPQCAGIERSLYHFLGLMFSTTNAEPSRSMALGSLLMTVTSAITGTSTSGI